MAGRGGLFVFSEAGRGGCFLFRGGTGWLLFFSEAGRGSLFFFFDGTGRGGVFLGGKGHNRVHPGHFPSREGENERRPISCAHSSWIKRSTLLCRKMTWVHPVVSFPLFFFRGPGRDGCFWRWQFFWRDGAKSLHRPAKGGLKFNRPISRPCKALVFLVSLHGD